MTGGAWVGVLLVFLGLFDLVLAAFVLGPRLPPHSRRPVQLALVIGAVVSVTLGILLLSGALGTGSVRDV